MSIIGSTTEQSYGEYLQFQPYQKWLSVVNTVISSGVFVAVAFVAFAYVRKLKERGMMMYLIGLILVSQAIYLCISWSALSSYWWIAEQNNQSNAANF